MSALVFSAGVPTAPDVKRLIDLFGIPSIGTTITHDQIATAISSPYRSYRYNSVVNAWRKQLYTAHNIVLKGVAGQGYEALDNSKRIILSSTKYKHSLRGIRRAAGVAAKTESTGLSSEEIRARDHIVRVDATLQLAAATAARDLRLTGSKSK